LGKTCAPRAQRSFADAAAYRIGNGSVALLFIHGFADTPCVWRRITRRLAEGERFTCRAMRLPGSAEPAAFARCQSLALWRTQVADELVRLREAHDAVWVVGHSLGGALALDAALRLPGWWTVWRSSPRSSMWRARGVRCCRRVSGSRWPASRSASRRRFESPFAVQGVAEDDPSFTFARDRFIPFRVYRALSG
jgi:pimeloyl-ACP methyl ester carboxylesterase